MTTLLHGESGLDAALLRWAATARRVGPWHWRFPLADPWLPGGRIDGEGGWLCLELPLENSRTIDHGWSLLRANGRLPGATKMALGPDGGAVLRAESPADESVDWPVACRELFDDLSRARLALDRGVTGRDATDDTGSTAEDAVSNEATAIRSEALAALCLERGWPAATRASGTVVVDLGGPAGFHPVSITPSRDGGARVTVEVLPRTALSAISRAALATLLLTASRIVRLARATADDGPDGAAIRFEVCFDRAPDATALDHALSALEVACLFCAREASMLVDERAARRYLEVRDRDRWPVGQRSCDRDPDASSLDPDMHHRVPGSPA